MSDAKIDKCLDSIHRIEIILTKIEADIEINTDDLSEHIRRTELLELKLSKLYTFTLIGMGFAVGITGPEAFKLIKALFL